ncbi:MAG: PQQ-binding-like beta-propeller repeat protein [Nannocystis sp.]|nr:PQQ-binding-like beta-propeller repeat protein [Nannocystis sp.]MBA3545253.1 PQQ-binding-like beta-propeller repeat protein [Nannocystis sp.]
MPQVIPARCPHCGASLKVDPRADSATCAYCGTTSLLRSKGTVAPGGAPVIIVASGGAKPLVIVGLVMVVVMVLVGVGVMSVTSRSEPAPAPSRNPVEVRPVEPVVRPPAPSDDATRLEVERLETGRRPLLADINGDATVDVLVLARLHMGERRWGAFTAFSGATGELLWYVDAPEDAQGTVAAVANGRLLLLTDAGQISGHELAAGKQQWSTALGDRGLRFCAATEPDSVLVPTADERVLLLDVKTGKQAPAQPSASCRPLPSDQEFKDYDPRNRSDPRAPAGVTGVHCGSVRVMGSENFTVADECRKLAGFDPDRLGGLVAHALWQTPRGWLVIGVRDPGTHTPLVARVQGKALAWKADVPEGNPLLASEGGPSPIVLAGDVIVAGYRLRTGQQPWLTGFSLEDGKRLWHVEAPGGKSIDGAAAAPGQVLVYADGSIFVLDAATGALLRTIGPRTP